ncbi:MAG: Tetratricopeptide 2 repeat protein [Pedosphaera sp.]|nr:Tetratricopeptide 2 repeat protein [Pedosphaera sp.]
MTLFAVAVLAGCTPAGPRALLDGKQLLEQGKYERAIEKLKLATSLLSTNAQAWNYLGLAYHQAGQSANAVEAYQKALKFNHDLVIVHYNLGCALLEQNKLEPARNELTAFTLHQGNSGEGWLKLGTVQLRAGDFGAAEKSFNEALRISPQNPEMLNNLGMTLLQRRRPHDAAAYFNAASKQQPNYAPALLNLAVVSQSYLNNRPLALQKYREYLALKPQPANWESVDKTMRQLDQELNPPARPVVVPPVIAANPVTNVLKPVVTNPVRGVATASNPPVPRSEVVINSPRQQAVAPIKPVPAPEPTVKPEVVKVAEAPVVKAAQDVSSNTRSAIEPIVAPPIRSQPPAELALDTKSAKKGFFQKMNPANLFKHEPKISSTLTPSSQPVVSTPADANKTSPVSTNPEVVPKATPIPVPAVATPVRYSYKSPAKPVAGNRGEAERLFAKALQAQRDHRTQEAVALYRKAAAADPSFFEAQSNLGLAAYDFGDMGLSLQSYENALAIKPDSFNGRYNFALALKRSGYAQDAAQELEKLLSGNSTEAPTHLAAAHLMLANLYADQLRQPQAARPHYVKALELDPQNSQGTAIRYWLRDNP